MPYELLLFTTTMSILFLFAFLFAFASRPLICFVPVMALILRIFFLFR